MGNNPYERQLHVGPFIGADATRSSGRAAKTGEQVMSQVHAALREPSSRKKLFFAQAIVTAPVIWTTEAGTGGPLLYNPSSSVEANIIAVGYGITTASTVSASIGLTGGYAESAPTSTTAIDSQGCLYVDASTPVCSVYRVGTTGTNRWFLPVGDVGTGAVTVNTTQVNWVNIDGMITVPYQSFVSIAASATLSTAVMNIVLVWEEVPVA